MGTLQSGSAEPSPAPGARAPSPHRVILAIVPDDTAGAAAGALMAAGCGVTRLASTGGVLHAGRTTLLAGAPAEGFDAILAALRAACRSHQGERGGGVVFVLNADSVRL